jgi:hypothetical protein
MQNTVSFELKTYIEQDECAEVMHLKKLVSRIIDATQSQPKQAGYPLVGMWVLSGLTTSLPFEPFFNVSRATLSSAERNRNVITTLPVFKQDRFALLAIATADTRLVDLLVVNVRTSAEQAVVVRDVQNVPRFDSSQGNTDLRPDAIQDICLHTHSGECIVTRGITNGVHTTKDRLFEPPPGFCQRDTEAWTLTHTTLTHFTRLEENAWGHHEITGYIAHVCEFMSEAGASVVFVSTPRVQWPPSPGLNPGLNLGDNSDTVIVMVSARL